MIKYRKRRKWKYTTEDDYDIFVSDALPDIEFKFLKIEGGRLYIGANYAWDGASGPALDSKKAMRPSLVHDAFYQLMREGILPVAYKKIADDIFYELLKENKMWAPRARVWYRAVAIGGPTHSYILEAP